jgi:radical SAM superfamily enzyme YgiQ (UPF0313 family)
MKITLIKPAISKIRGRNPVKTWNFQPLSLALLAGITPKNIEIKFYDDRIEDIPLDEATDLVCISVETFNALRAYQIASEYKKRNIKTLLGGFHPSAVPDEALIYCDSVVIGEAEGVWDQVLSDAKNRKLKSTYHSPHTYIGQPARSIFRNKKYIPITLIEAGRGCHYKCEFCSVHKFYNGYFPRPVDDVVNEIKKCGKKYFLFVDDSLTADLKRSKNLFRALIPLKIKWVGQSGIRFARDKEILKLMKQSGCIGLLIGFESLNRKNLFKMRKADIMNKKEIETLCKRLSSYAIGIYASFIFGYEYDKQDNLKETINFAIKNKYYLAGFNPLMPYPGTDLYKRLSAEGRLINSKWWLENSFRYGDIIFNPRNLSRLELQNAAIRAKKIFYSIPKILYRSFNLSVTLRSFSTFYYYFITNLLARYEINKKTRMRIGLE